LVDFWKERVYIGSPKEIFGSYKLISDEKLKNDIKKEFQILYNSMKKIHPGLEEVTWD
jgi:predicted transcriptional regulator